MSVRHRTRWVIGGVMLLLIVIVAAGYFYLKSNSFQQFAISKIVEQANSATGGRTEIGRMDFQLSNLTAHLYDITVHGTEGPADPPLLHADKLTVQLKIVSALHHQVSLRELLIDHPVVSVQVNRQGTNNLPTAPPSKSSGSSTNLFDLAVEHVQLTNGEVNYNDRKTPLAADLFNLATDVHFEPSDKAYVGGISYQNGHLRYAQYAPLPHNLDAKFRATPQQMELSPATLKLGSSEVQLNTTVSNYSNPVATGDYRIRIHTQDFAEFSPTSAPAGDVLLTGKLNYKSVENQSLMRNVAVEGDLASDVLSAAASGNRLELRRLHGTYRLGNGNLELRDVGVETLGGRLVATAEMKHLDTTPESSVRASLSGISLKALQRFASKQEIPAASISGMLRGKAEAAWKGSIQNLRAHSDLYLQAVAASRSNPSATDVPVNGAFHVAYDGPRQTIELHDTTLQLPAATLTAQGSVSDHSNLQVQVVAKDLHQLAALAFSFRPTQSAPPSISGSATVNASVRGSMKHPTIVAQLEGDNMQLQGSQWKSLHVAMHANQSQFAIENASLVNAEKGQANLSASVALSNWAYRPSNSLNAHVQVQQIRLADLQRMAGKQYPISGDLNVNATLQGSQLKPVGSGTAQIANAIAYGEKVQTLGVRFNAANGQIDSTLQVAAAAGAINGTLSYTPETKAYKVRIDAPSVVLQKLHMVQEKNLGVAGTVSATVNGEGTVDNPGLVATVQLPQLQVRDKSIGKINADLRVAEHRANLALDTDVSQAAIHARGTVSLTGDYETQATIDTGTIPLGVVMATYVPSVPQGFDGKTELHVSLRGPLKDKSRMEAHLSIPVLQAKYQALEIGIPRPIRADYVNSVVTLQPSEIQGTGTSLRAQGQVPLTGTRPASLSAQGSVDVRILKIFSPNVQSSGVIALDVRSSGTPSKPDVQGQLQFKNVALSTLDAPVGVENLNGAMDVSNDHVRLSNMTAQIGGGQVSLGGSISYRPSVQFNVSVQGQSVRLRYPTGLRSVLDTNLSLTGTTQASTLNGRVFIDNLSFTPDFDLSKFGDQFSTGTDVSQPGFADTVKLGITVQSRQNVNAVSSQISIAGQANLQVGGTAANPVITGRTTLTSGELFYRNVRYDLERGIITFDDPNVTHPVLNVSVNTLIEQYKLTLNLRGPLDKLTTAYVSDPPLATADIINLVARGKTTEEQAASSQSTDSMIASQVAGQLSSSVQKLAGLSSLQIDPTLGGANSNPSARIAIQQRVTKNLLFSFSTDVSQPGSEIVQGEYQITRRWSVSMERDQLGGVSVDGKYHSRF